MIRRLLEEEAEDGARRARLAGNALGFCPDPDCGADYRSGFPHLEGCRLAGDPRYAPRTTPPPVTLEPSPVRVRRTVHLAIPGASLTICGASMFWSERVPGRPVTCAACRAKRGTNEFG